MDKLNNNLGLLDLLLCPAFTVENNMISSCNSAAKGMLLEEGTPIGPMVGGVYDSLDALEDGCLYLNLTVGGQNFGATAVKVEGKLTFLLDASPEAEALRALALAARELRGPLTGLMSTLDTLRSSGVNAREAAMLERNLHRMLRIVCNMSDAGQVPTASRQEATELCAFFREVFEKAAAISEPTGVQLSFKGSEQPIYTLCDRELLERAVLNLVGNSMKFTPAGGSIYAELSRHGRFVQLRITDSGSGIAGELKNSLFRRYLRQPAIEDDRHGIGLGLVMVRSAALAHGGTVLIDQPGEMGTRATLTLAIRQDSNKLRSDVFHVDYAGEWDRTLLELSETLPIESFLP